VDLDDAAHAVVRVLASIGGESAARHLTRAQSTAAVRQLFRVAASLDSLVLGEPQILGQLKDAIEAARDAKTLGPTLGKATHRAVRVGKRVRTETALGAGQVSVSSVAVDLAQQIFEELSGRVTLLVGAGEMAEAASKLLARAGARLILVNRSPERAAALARDLGTGEVRPWGDLQRSLVEADIVISSTSSPGYVVTRDLVKTANKARRGRSLFLIDIAVPRDIEPSVNKLDGVFLYDVDDLSQIVAESLEGRAAEATRAEAIVVEEVTSFEAWTQERALTPTIVGLRERTRSLLAAELDRSLSGKLRHLSAADRDALRVMVEAATNKLLHAPTARLRALATDPRGADYVEALRDLFDLTDGGAEKPLENGEGGPEGAWAKEREPRDGEGALAIQQDARHAEP
jgi:glutamyl-tRNA reductase